MKIKLYFLSLFLSIFFQLPGQVSFDQAVALSQSGQYREADLLFHELTQQQENNHIKIMQARAYNYSWWGKSEKSIILFETVLELQPDLESAKGLAFAYYYQGKHKKAIRSFKTALQYDQYNQNVLEGMLHASLRLERSHLSQNVLRKLISIEPDNSNYHYLKGRLAYRQGLMTQARSSINKSLLLEPNNDQARKLQKTINTPVNRWLLSTWLGLGATEGDQKIGMRRLDLFFRTSRKNLIFSFFDNSLGFENIQLIENKSGAPLIGIGDSYTWNKYLNTTIIVGSRLDNGNNKEKMVRIEQNLFATEDTRIASGITFHRLNSDQTTSVYNIGIENKFSALITIQAQYYHTINNFDDNSASRYVIIPKITMGPKVVLTSSIYFSRERQEGLVRDGTSGLFNEVAVQMTSRLNAKILFHYQREVRNTILSGGIGLAYSF